MGLLDKLLGRDEPHRTAPATAPSAAAPGGAPQSEDEQAVERYRYLLRTAPPDQVEAAHAEAFATLTPEQRQQVLGQLGDAVPEGERPTSDDPRQLARAATRAEVRQPGTLERSFGGAGRGGPGFGSMVGASLLGTVAGVVVGTAVADALFDSGAGEAGGEDATAAEDAGGYEDAGGGDFGGDVGGDFGGDFGGGDF